MKPQLVEEYVKTGQVLFEYRDFAFLGEESTRAAEAAACAADQDQFWQYHDSLFLNQGAENSGVYSGARLEEIARQMGLDTDQFNRCVDQNTHADEVAAMADEARASNITSTPSLVVNGELIRFSGYQSLKNAIEAELNQ